MFCQVDESWLTDVTFLNERWQERIKLLEVQERLRTTGLRAISKMLHRTQSLAFSLLVERVHEIRRARLTISRLVALQQRKALEEAWQLFDSAACQAADERQWQESRSNENYVATMSLKSEIERMQADVEQLQARLNSDRAAGFSKFVLRMLHVNTSKAFQRWQTNVKKILRVATIFNKMILRMELRRLAVAVSTWRAHAAEQHRLWVIGRRALFRLRSKCLWLALDAWRTNVNNIIKMAAKARKVMMRWMNYEASMCLDNWRETTVQEVRKRGLMKRIVSRMGSKRMSYAFIRSALDPRMDIGHAVGGMKAKLT